MTTIKMTGPGNRGPAPAELLDAARGMNADLPANPTREECIEAMMARAIACHLPMQVVMGSAFDDEMEQVPWRATLWPVDFRDSPEGLRVMGRVEPVGSYLVTGDNQRPGMRHLLLSALDEVTPIIE